MYDIVFIGPQNNEWKKLKSRFITAKQVNTLEEAQSKVFTKMFWAVWPDTIILDDFDFSYQADEYSLDVIHIFKNGKYFDGICLFPKKISISNKEIEYRYFMNKKEIDIQASIPKSFDIVFISYQEPTADKNYHKLTSRFPDIKRVHGVKGIHEAHKEAALQCDTEMFWVVDGDAEIVDSFSFNYQVERHNYNCVHVWRSVNPINDLTYGYGGVKLLPRKMTLEMDMSKPDMTTSISPKFKAVPEISNITAFNTDPFNTWKSAFRECVKLASKTIQGQKNEETEQRLETWCTTGRTKPFGEFAIAGACAGRRYGTDNANGADALKLINDFDWLQEQFNAISR